MILLTEFNEAYLNRKKKESPADISRSYFYFLKNNFEKVKVNLHVCSSENLTIVILPKKLL